MVMVCQEEIHASSAAKPIVSGRKPTLFEAQILTTTLLNNCIVKSLIDRWQLRKVGMWEAGA
jgi:hypothetical protein